MQPPAFRLRREDSAAENAQDVVRWGREILRFEAQALQQVEERLDESFHRAAELIHRCQGSVIVTGMGKAGLVGQKIAATLASTGTRAHPVHPAEAVHGDLGRIASGDVVLALSHSGETEEVVRLLPPIKKIGAEVLAITSRRESTLGQYADVTIALGPLEEACPLGLAPSASTTAMMAVGDALALAVSRLRGFRREDFAFYHPAGALGRQLMKVEEVMRQGRELRVAGETQTVRDVFVAAQCPGRRTGAIMLVDGAGRLSGLFTDSDLARVFERRRDEVLDGPIAAVMTRNPQTVPNGSLVADALRILSQRKISELPVVDSEGRPVGLVDITDLIGLTPADNCT